MVVAAGKNRGIFEAEEVGYSWLRKGMRKSRKAANERAMLPDRSVFASRPKHKWTTVPDTFQVASAGSVDVLFRGPAEQGVRRV